MKPLKEATAEKHKQAERMPFNIRMFRAQLTKEEYLLYLIQQAKIFEAIEQKGTPHPSLNRYDRVQADIQELQPTDGFQHEVLEGTRAYADYLKTLNAEEVLPHVYLNYLALMYGGQMMKKSVPSMGRMYDFDNMQEALLAIRSVQKDEWADEVNKGFDFLINIFDELEKVTVQS
ncbi:MAG: biliverdin-producing heme oxygenase [Cyclobacteriaceae bacterium]|nr:biliverdin-producing heme oxygenase [Cyclobacteriaceae bacterium]UYN86017.1 MAG: biliverdin-producing heme oxygenase [Cyclobacteriaceae bacterium]